MSNNGGNNESTIKYYVFLVGVVYTLAVATYFMQRHLVRCLCRKQQRYQQDSAEPHDKRTYDGCYREASQLFSGNQPIIQVCDERDYQSWTVDQVVYWVNCKLMERVNQTPSSIVGSTIQYACCAPQHHLQGTRQATTILRTQCIDGASLEHLTLPHLLSFGIPFGIAVHLTHALEDLIHDTTAFQSDRSRTTDLPSWYETNKPRRPQDRLNKLEADIEMTENVQNIMKDRYGMSLPSLRGADSDDQDAMLNKMPDIESQGKQELIENSDPEQHDSNTIPLITEELLKSMPPYIREVAKRRPDLVARLLEEKQQQIQKNTTLLSLEPISEECSEQMHKSSLCCDEIESMHEHDAKYDSEYVGLLRRRVNR